MIEAISPVVLPIIENIPEELKQRPQWVLWRYEERDEKLTKIPYSTAGWWASSTDPTTWSTFGEALTTQQKRGHDGIGFVFSDDDPYCGIDLDKCRVPQTGEISAWAKKIINRVPEGYAEISPSGTGIHIIVEGTVRGGGMRKGPVEMYSRARFFTITGVLL
jgi:putative DNA primase/helicase